jgi:tetratricopeptide (TPR) repeat protein
VDRSDFAAALPFLLKAVELSPANAQFLSELGHVYQNGKQWPKALETFDQAVAGARTLPDKANNSAELRRALRDRGFPLVELNRLDEAEKVYAECLELDPSDATAKGEPNYITSLRLKPAAAK